MNFDEIKSSILFNKIAMGQDQLKEGLEHQIKMGQLVEFSNWLTDIQTEQ